MGEKVGDKNGEVGGINENISMRRYGVIHSQIGFSDGVSIVMKQMESVLTKNLNISKSNILYLVGKSNIESKRVTEAEVLWDRYKVNLMMLNHFESGYGGGLSEKIELAIWNARVAIEKWVSENNIDILIVHNSSHPVNFIASVVQHIPDRNFKMIRYYGLYSRKGKKKVGNICLQSSLKQNILFAEAENEVFRCSCCFSKMVFVAYLREPPDDLVLRVKDGRFF